MVITTGSMGQAPHSSLQNLIALVSDLLEYRDNKGMLPQHPLSQEKLAAVDNALQIYLQESK